MKFGCCKKYGYLETGAKKRTGILLDITKLVAPRVKTQARGQNNWSRALK